MTPLPLDDVDLVAAWPNQHVAAEMLGVSGSTLSRRDDLEFEVAGARTRHYRPAAVLRAAAYYKRRSLNAVAAKLIAHAREHGGEDRAGEVQTEVDAFFAQRPSEPVDRERILREARRALPRQLYLEVQRAFEQDVAGEPELQGAEVDFGARSVEAG
ncbi:MAG TPA: hypothetical protein VFT19_11245 [Solirubrobacterales bacterium]|nr:hypothetical protein [Solirubrobacterales bacterium]